MLLVTYCCFVVAHTPRTVAAERSGCSPRERATPNLPTNIVDFGGFDSSIILNLRGEIPRPTGELPESLSQAMLVGIMLVGRLGAQGGDYWNWLGCPL